MDDAIIPVTVKFRIKLRADGGIDKLKSRVCLRGDKQSELVDWDTWCPIAGFRALRIFLAFASQSKCRVYQLDFIGAFLQASSRNTTYTTSPAKWAEFFPDMAAWFGKALRLKKSLYGAVDAGRNWDDELHAWLSSQDFLRCPAEGSIYFKFQGEWFLFLLNAVDDLLYFSNNPTMRTTFEATLQDRFDVDFIGQAHWYLQSRVSQNSDYSIELDQARYSSLILSRFVPSLSLTSISDEDRKRYNAPLPAEYVATKEDCASDSFEVLRLDQEFGFKYSSLIGMLIFLLNTAFLLQFSIRKLAKFMAMPRRKHYQAAAHLLRYLRCNYLSLGLKFYPTLADSPLYAMVSPLDSCPSNIGDFPLILFTDSSWQDCPDTSRSTGSYLIYLNGGLIDGASFVPSPVALSSAES